MQIRLSIPQRSKNTSNELNYSVVPIRATYLRASDLWSLRLWKESDRMNARRRNSDEHMLLLT